MFSLRRTLNSYFLNTLGVDNFKETGIVYRYNTVTLIDIFFFYQLYQLFNKIGLILRTRKG